MRLVLPTVLLALATPLAAAHIVQVGPLYLDHHDNTAWCESNGLAGLQKGPTLVGTTLYDGDTRIAPGPGNLAACAP